MRLPTLSIRNRVVLLLLAFGLAPAALLGGAFLFERSELRSLATARLADAAVTLNDTIDRNLFERYGDVQAFGLNAVARDPRNWRRSTEDNPLVRVMDQYVAAYGVYKLALLVSPGGEVLAVNGRDAAGKTIRSADLYSLSLANAPWLGKALRGEFLAGPEGLTGTVVEQPSRSDLVSRAYPGEDGYSVVFAAPVRDANGTTIAVWANFADFGLVEQIVTDFHRRLAGTGMAGAEVTVLDPSGAVIVDYDPTARPGPYRRDFGVIGVLNLAQRGDTAAVAAVRGEAGSDVSRDLRKNIDQAAGYARSQGAMGYPGLGWSALVRAPTSEAFVVSNRIETLALGLLALTAALILPLGLWIGTGFVRPLVALGRTMRALASGEAVAAVPGEGRRDEVGDMAAAVTVFRDNMAEAATLRTQQEAERLLAENNKRDALRAMAERVEAEASAAVSRISDRTGTMADDADGMARIANAVAARSSAVASAAEQALGGTQAVVAATEQLSASIGEISVQISNASATTQRAAERGRASDAVIRDLSDATARVSEVVRLIADIASKTNLLALNATIEAARAGEAGKGFAVVAGEVKALAAQTGKATEEIGRQVAEIGSATASAMKMVRDIALAVDEIGETSAAIAAAVEEQSAATQEIARTVSQTADAAREVSEQIGQVSTATAEAGARALDVRAGATEARAAVADMLGVLVCVVRTATPEVDRRTEPRIPLQCRVTLDAAGGAAQAAQLVDISLNGAMVSGGPILARGARTILRVPGIATDLPCEVISATEERLRLRFVLNHVARTALTASLSEASAAAA